MGLNDRGYYKPMGFRGFSFFPPVIKYLLIANGIVFLLQALIENITFSGGVPGFYYLNRYFALNPIVGLDQIGAENNFQIWQLFTYQFMHGGFTHILMNMFILWMFGMEIENMWGSSKFLAFYLIGGVGAGLLQIFLSPVFSDSLAPTIGASGAVYAVLIAFAIFNPDRYIFLYFLVPVKAKYFIAFWVVLDFLAIGSPSPVAHLAHVGGALTGFIFIFLDKRYNFNFDKLFSSIKNYSSSTKNNFNFRKPTFRSSGSSDIKEAKFYDISEDKNSKEEISQEVIDRILDKISQSGYQNLSKEEKRILFEASQQSRPK
jgi:membrane associated rhomboid family serine protease